MRCKACDAEVKEPTKVVDQYDGKVYEEWLCNKCNRLSFISNPDIHDNEDSLLLEAKVQGFIRQEEL